MKYRYVVEVEVERQQGKFASREDLGGQIEEAIAGADPGDLTGENDGEYSVTQWDVTEEEL